jgi:hypothetical protein
MANIAGGYRHGVTQASKGCRQAGDDRVGVERLITGCWHPAATNQGPELGRPVEGFKLDRDPAEAHSQGVEPAELRRCSQADQFPAYFVIGDGRDNGVRRGGLDVSQPGAAPVDLSGPGPSAGQSERPGVEEDEPGHSIHPFEELLPRPAVGIDPSHHLLFRLGRILVGQSV